MLLVCILSDDAIGKVQDGGRFPLWLAGGEDVDLGTAEDAESLRPEAERSDFFVPYCTRQLEFIIGF